MKIITLTEQAHDTLCEALETLQERTLDGGFRQRLRSVWAQVLNPKAIKAKVEVSGGVAEVTQCPEGVTIEIQDHDNERHQ